jgi:hypothetical protein
MDLRILTGGWLDAPSIIDYFLLVGFLRLSAEASSVLNLQFA